VSDPVIQAIAELEAYLRRYPSGHFSELAQLQLDQLLARQGEKKVQVVSAAANPFSMGTAVANLGYRVGDRYEYQVTDLLTKLPERVKIQRVVSVTADKVLYMGVRIINDLLGNTLQAGNGARFGPNQFFAAEYTVGKKWSTRYPIVFPNGDPDDVEIDFRVTGRETVTVPAGTFDCFRVEGAGWVLGKARAIAITYWMAPDKVARVIAIDTWHRQQKGRQGNIRKADREELVAFTPAG